MSYIIRLDDACEKMDIENMKFKDKTWDDKFGELERLPIEAVRAK